MPVYDLTGKEAANSVTGELTVVMPVYNEAATIALVLVEWGSTFQTLQIPYTFVLIDDGSGDRTLDILKGLEKEKGGMVIVCKSNSGHGRSCRLGYDIACASSVEWVLQIDSDGQCDPAYFAEFWEKRENKDCVFGVRKKRDDGWARSFTSRICRWGGSLLAGVDLIDPNVPYRLIRKNVLKQALEFVPQGFDLHNMALTVVLKSLKQVRWKYVDIHFRERQGGRNSINILGVAQLGASMLFDLMRLSWKLKKSLPS